MKTKLNVLAAAIALVASGSAMAAGTKVDYAVSTSVQDAGSVQKYTVQVGAGASGAGVAVGGDAVATSTTGDAYNTVAVGRTAQALKQGGTALGANTYTTELDATAAGVLSEAHASRSTAVGTYATVFEGATNSTALGERSSVSSGDIKAAGTKSKFTDTAVNDATVGVVSVGQSKVTYAVVEAAYSSSGTDTNSTTYTDTNSYYKSNGAEFARRIINVAGGVDDTDAVNIAQLTKVNDDLTTKIDANTKSIATNTANIATNTANIATNTANIAANTARIDAVENRISKVEQNANDGAALALATAGLVQPPEGKSGVVIGTGFYRESSAVALGYAYTGKNWGIKATASAAGRGNFGGTASAGFFW